MITLRLLVGEVIPLHVATLRAAHPKRRLRMRKRGGVRAGNASYDGDFYDAIDRGSLPSARTVVPMVINLVGRPASVVDVGCGSGAWLRALAEEGVEDYLGLDGDYVSGRLQIPADHFRATDIAGPLELPRRFDLVVCLEVAEHLPASTADTFVDSLVGLGDAVLFSAAIPYQGGVHHVNEQWPEYWATKFRARGYVALDPFRRRLWNDDQVDTWFAQNLVLYVTGRRAASEPRLGAELARSEGVLLSLVHPRLYLSKARTASRVVWMSQSPVARAARTLRSALGAGRGAG
jgi:SAM-dependent methyltransferase